MIEKYLLTWQDVYKKNVKLKKMVYIILSYFCKNVHMRLYTCIEYESI